MRAAPLAAEAFDFLGNDRLIDPPAGRQSRHAGDRGAEIAEIGAPLRLGRGSEGEIGLPRLAVEGRLRTLVLGETGQLKIEIRLDVFAARL